MDHCYYLVEYHLKPIFAITYFELIIQQTQQFNHSYSGNSLIRPCLAQSFLRFDCRMVNFDCNVVHSILRCQMFHLISMSLIHSVY